MHNDVTNCGNNCKQTVNESYEPQIESVLTSARQLVDFRDEYNRRRRCMKSPITAVAACIVNSDDVTVRRRYCTAAAAAAAAAERIDAEEDTAELI